MSSQRCCQVCVWSLVRDVDGLPWRGARVYHHRCRLCLCEYVASVGGGCCYGVSLRWCACGIPLEGEEEVVAVPR